MLVERANHKARLNGYKAGKYLVVEIIADKDEYSIGGELICRKGETYYYHLQYPTRQEVYDHLQYLKHAGKNITTITDSDILNADESRRFCMPIYDAQRYRQCGHNVKKFMGLLA